LGGRTRDLGAVFDGFKGVFAKNLAISMNRK
jgi:hypothetical protein